MTIYAAVGMKDGVHYIASNIMQCTKQLKAMKFTDFSEPTNYILIQKRLNSHLQFVNLDADMKRAAAAVCRHELDLLLLPAFATCRSHILP